MTSVAGNGTHSVLGSVVRMVVVTMASEVLPSLLAAMGSVLVVALMLATVPVTVPEAGAVKPTV